MSAMEEIVILTADGLSLGGEIYGAPDAKLIILLHGGGQSRSAWRGAARRLAAAGYRACAMDLRGHGGSDWSPNGVYRLDDFVADLAAIIRELGAPAVLVGASFGGHVAMLTAARHPELCRALLLADVTPWIDEASGDHFRCTLRTSAKGFASLDEAAAMIAQLQGASSASVQPERLKRNMRVGADGRFYWKWDVRFLDDREIRRGGEGGLFVTEARKLRAPILVMAAELSNLTSPREIAAFQRAVAGVETVSIVGARHMLTGDVNDAYADAILIYLSRLD